MLFMSYAEEDSEIGAAVAAWLSDRGYEVFNWLAPEQRGGQFIQNIEAAIGQAEDFLALLSPSYLASPWCRKERNLALQREMDLQHTEADRTFIFVLLVADTPAEDTGFLRDYDYQRATSVAEVRVLDVLARRWKSQGGTKDAIAAKYPPPSPEPDAGVDPLRFRNREQELDMVRHGLMNPGGQHFWLVTAPPQLGKSWFIKELEEHLSEQVGWVTTLVDLRAEPPEKRVDAVAVLSRLLGMEIPTAVDGETLLAIAAQLSGTNKRRLCLLDSAELLSSEATKLLRKWLCEIYNLVQGADRADAGLALVVASRIDDEWRGVTPSPRMSVLSLSEFNETTVQQALYDLNVAMGRKPFDLTRTAASAHQLTEGLPALLVRCLQWIREQHWVGLGRLDGQALFEALADPYVRAGLLSTDSLFPERREASIAPADASTDPRALVLENSYRVLVPYRLFTQSHLRYHIDNDPELRAAFEATGWSVIDLWQAINGGAMASQLPGEPWYQMNAPIRRLLFRYFYPSQNARTKVHEDARKFVEIWNEQQLGTEQTIGLVECLWHDAMALNAHEGTEFRRRMTESATDLSRGIKPSPLYTVAELRLSASEKARADDELEKACAHCPDLFTDLIEIVRNPPSET